MKAAFYTLGCKVNQYETEVLKARFSEKGFEIVPPTAAADVFVINSCTVTAVGDKKTRQMLRRFRRENPLAVIAVTGCYPQAFPDAADKLPEADVVTGAQNRAALPDHVLRVLQSRTRVVEIEQYANDTPFEPMATQSFSEHTRAFVKIEDGCDRYCSYCIIPKARGPVRSKPLDDLNAELHALAANGYREVVLVGVNLSCYGKDLHARLCDAVELACAVDGISRVRLGSLEPELLTDADLARMAAQEKFCPQFHLSLQSGCDETLKRMNRHYTTAEYAELVEKIRRHFDNPAITTDLMVGFPDETEDAFVQSRDFLVQIGFAKTHVFAYSVRAGTRAAVLDRQISAREKERRSAEMIAAANRTRAAFLQTQVGRTESVLFETQTDGLAVGYTKNYTPVALCTDTPLCGEIRTVRITRSDGERCYGEL